MANITHHKQKRHPLLKLLCCVLSLLLLAAGLIVFFRNERIQQIEDLLLHQPPGDELTVTYIDVGQGNATLITLNEHSLLIDGGPNDSANRILEAIEKAGIKKLEYVLSSHPDADHIGALDEVITAYPPGHFIMTEVENDTASYKRLMKTIEQKKVQPWFPSVPVTIPFGDALLRVIPPNDPNPVLGINNTSIAVDLQYKSHRFLFTGDAELVEEMFIVNHLEPADAIQSTVLLAGHHGSSTSTTPYFLLKVVPNYTVISCGKGNDYGHPHDSTIKRLNAVGSQILRTDQLGTIAFHSDGSVLSFTTQ